jgi:hypothetical protein
LSTVEAIEFDRVFDRGAVWFDRTRTIGEGACIYVDVSDDLGMCRCLDESIALTVGPGDVSDASAIESMTLSLLVNDILLE